MAKFKDKIQKGVLVIPGWVKMPTPERKVRGFFPNDIWRYPARSEGVVILRLTANEGASIVKEVVDYYNRLVVREEIVAFWVVMTDPEGNYIGETSIEKVSAELFRAKPNAPSDPDFNPYFWLTRDFKLSTKEDFVKRKRSSEYGVL